MRLLGGLGLAAALVGCHTPPHKLTQGSPSPSASSDLVLTPEPTAPLTRQAGFDCDFETPNLAILSTQWLLDGSPVTEWELQKRLNAKRELYAQIGGRPTRQMMVQTTEDVSPTELGKVVQIARSFGYDEISFATSPAVARVKAKKPNRGR